MALFSEEQHKLFEEPNLVTVASVAKDGTPRSTAIWVDIDGDDILLNGAQSRNWLRNLERNPKVALSIYSLKNPYQQVNVVGEVVSISAEGAEDHIDKLSRKYTGQNYPNHLPNDPRMLARVKVKSVAGMLR